MIIENKSSGLASLLVCFLRVFTNIEDPCVG